MELWRHALETNSKKSISLENIKKTIIFQDKIIHFTLIFLEKQILKMQTFNNRLICFNVHNGEAIQQETKTKTDKPK